MKPLDPTPRDDFTNDDLPGWTPEEVVELNKLPHNERVALRLKAEDERKAAEYPDRMTRPDGSRQGDGDAEHFDQEHRKQQEAEERRQLENAEMEKHFRDHPHG